MGDHLVGTTNLLRPYMHGFFVNQKLCLSTILLYWRSRGRRASRRRSTKNERAEYVARRSSVSLLRVETKMWLTYLLQLYQHRIMRRKKRSHLRRRRSSDLTCSRTIDLPGCSRNKTLRSMSRVENSRLSIHRQEYHRPMNPKEYPEV